MFVSKDGLVEVNGEEASMSQLEGALGVAASAEAIVLFSSRFAQAWCAGLPRNQL